MKPIALQLYTVRDAASKDFIGTLKKVADMGYQGVEFAGLHGADPKEIAKVIADLGLVTSSSHTAMPSKENIQQIVDTEKTLGNSRIVSGFGPDQFKTLDGRKEAVAKFTEAAEQAKTHGFTFAFHNHWWEFEKLEDGRYVYDMLMEEVPGVSSELDTYWCAFGGADAVETINKYKSRLPLLHIKDGTLQKDTPQKAVGSGAMKFEPIIKAADPTVLEWLIVENDDADIDMLEAARMGYAYLSKL